MSLGRPGVPLGGSEQPGLFDEDPAASGPREMHLARLVVLIKRQLHGIGEVRVEGEVQRPSQRERALYFTLKDRAHQIGVVLPQQAVRVSLVRDGERVAVTGRVELYAEHGRLQLRATQVVPVGAGAIAAHLDRVRERLRAAGLLDRPRRALPLLPTAIGVVCGTDAAVRHDIESVVAARFPGYPLVFREVTVSGPGAPEAIEDAIARLVRTRGVEVIVLARGGGDAAQLLPFSDEVLCRAIAVAPVPIVSAIGHEADRPISDDVADARAGTPSLAAALVVPDRAALQGRIDAALTACGAATRLRSERAAAQLGRVQWTSALDRRLESSALALASVDWRRGVDRAFAGAHDALARIAWQGVAAQQLSVAHSRLVAAKALADAMSPQRVLERGYAVVRRPVADAHHTGESGGDAGAVRDAATLQRGDGVVVQLARGTFTAQVSDVDPTRD